MIKSLELGHDFRDVDAIRELEAVFGVKLEHEETLRWFTVGDAEDGVAERVAARADRDGKCPTSMAFYRLRGVLQRGTTERIQPSTLLSKSTTLTVKALLDRIHRLTGLQVPQTASIQSLVGMTIIGASLVALIVCIAAAFAPGVLLTLAGAALGAWIGASDPGWHPADFTVGDLARMTAQRSVVRLKTEGARLDARFVRGAVRSLLAEAAEVDERKVERATRLV